MKKINKLNIMSIFLFFNYYITKHFYMACMKFATIYALIVDAQTSYFVNCQVDNLVDLSLVKPKASFELGIIQKAETNLTKLIAHCKRNFQSYMIIYVINRIISR